MINMESGGFKRSFPTNIQYNKNGTSIIAHMLADQTYIFNLKETDENSIIPLDIKPSKKDIKIAKHFYSKVFKHL